MTPRETGRQRDARIIALAADSPVTARQVAALLFPSGCGLHLARRRLHALAERGEVLRHYFPDLGWVYATQRQQLGRKARHGVWLSELRVRLALSGALRQWEQEVVIDGGQADARTVLEGIGEVWWEIERDRRFDRWDLYGHGRAVCIWTTDQRAGQPIPAGSRAAVGGWSEDPIGIALRLPQPAAQEVRTLRDELAAAAPSPERTRRPAPPTVEDMRAAVRR